MKRHVALVHWRMAEAKPLITLLERADYEVHYGGEVKPIRATQLKQFPVVAAIIDLTRMPSYGKYWAAELRATSMKHLPIVFVDGEPAKVAMVKASLPDATYTTREKLLGVLKKLKPVANPVKPSRMMLSTRPNALKMGVKPGARVAVFDAPAGYGKIIGSLPDGAAFEEEAPDADVTLWFVRDVDTYLTGLRRMRPLAAKSRLWVLYPKQQKGKAQTISQADVRESAIAVGLVDYKICSVDETWSGIAFAMKRS